MVAPYITNDQRKLELVAQTCQDFMAAEVLGSDFAIRLAAEDGLSKINIAIGKLHRPVLVDGVIKASPNSPGKFDIGIRVIFRNASGDDRPLGIGLIDGHAHTAADEGSEIAPSANIPIKIGHYGVAIEIIVASAGSARIDEVGIGRVVKLGAIHILKVRANRRVKARLPVVAHGCADSEDGVILVLLIGWGKIGSVASVGHIFGTHERSAHLKAQVSAFRFLRAGRAANHYSHSGNTANHH